MIEEHSNSSVVAAASLPTLRLKRNEDRRLHAGHLWVFSNEVDTRETALGRFKPGQLVRVLSHHDKALGIAYVNPNSLICARLLETHSVPDDAWFAARMEQAMRLRTQLNPRPFYRLVYGESDGLPGLVIDRYGSRCVVQIGTAGMEAFKPLIQRAVRAITGCDALLFKNDSGAREAEGLPSYVETALGDFESSGTVVEDEVEFEIPLTGGQKTGWFFDQASNRHALGRYVFRGSRVLDVFSYVGAWGLRAASCGASEVICVDSSAPALEFAARTAARNRLDLGVRRGDAFEVLEALAVERRRFDVVVIDPPAFAKRRKDVPKALAAYKRINQLALRLLADGGTLVSCSCSHQVSARALQDVIAKAAAGCGRRVQILESRTQAPDHPVHPAIPETEYLKVFFCRVNERLE